MILSELFYAVLGLVLTVMILSYLLGDNIFFRIAAHLFVGLSTGYLVVVMIAEVLIPYLVMPLVQPGEPDRLWMVVPLLLVGLLIVGQIPGYAIAARIPLAFLTGVSAAVIIGGAVFGTLLPQVKMVFDVFNPQSLLMRTAGAGWRLGDALIILLGAVSTLAYFHFGRKRKLQRTNDHQKRPVVLEALSRIGQVFIGFTLGALFVGIYSAVLAALVNRLDFLVSTIFSWMGRL